MASSLGTAAKNSAVIVNAQKEQKSDNEIVNTNPIELGCLITWHYAQDLQNVLPQSKQQNKPVLILFQEIPGCAGCKNYGKNVLSSQIIHKLITDNFIPVAIYNNRGGKDAQILNSFKECSWNYPVLRVIDCNMNNIVPRLDDWRLSVEGVQAYLLNALAKWQSQVSEAED